MLGQGHTAKSIAVAKGISVAAVNERLRAARRKTGIGSSRELARFVRLQKNSDEEIEVSADTASAPSSRWPMTIGFGRRAFMPVFVIFALGAAYLTLHQNVPAIRPTTSASAPSDPLLAGMDDPSVTLTAMHRRVRSENRDETWASRSEDFLRKRYGRVPNLSAGGNDVRVLCARSLCEVAAALPKTLTRRQMTKLVEDLQSMSLIVDLRAEGLQNITQGFGESFITYCQRKDPRSAREIHLPTNAVEQ